MVGRPCSAVTSGRVEGGRRARHQANIGLAHQSVVAGLAGRGLKVARQKPCGTIELVWLSTIDIVALALARGK